MCFSRCKQLLQRSLMIKSTTYFWIAETPESFEVDIDVPGVKKEDITIDVKDR